jgi:hypothetical protein
MSGMASGTNAMSPYSPITFGASIYPTEEEQENS